MTELGVLAYPDLSPMDKIKEYLQLASKYGFTRVSSSMLSVEGTNEEIISYFKEFNHIAHEFGMLRMDSQQLKDCVTYPLIYKQELFWLLVRLTIF